MSDRQVRAGLWIQRLAFYLVFVIHCCFVFEHVKVYLYILLQTKAIPMQLHPSLTTVCNYYLVILTVMFMDLSIFGVQCFECWSTLKGDGFGKQAIDKCDTLCTPSPLILCDVRMSWAKCEALLEHKKINQTYSKFVFFLDLSHMSSCGMVALTAAVHWLLLHAQFCLQIFLRNIECIVHRSLSDETFAIDWSCCVLEDAVKLT